MFYLLPLIIVTFGQQCPYCRWNACNLTSGGLASCSDCYLGTLVSFQLEEPGLTQNETLGICVFCPSNCNSCEYAVLSPAMSTPVPAVNCTDCASRFVNSYFDGSCQPCAQNCLTCSCVFNDCSTTICSECDEGYTLNSSLVSTQCQPDGRRLFTQEISGSGTPEELYVSLSIGVLSFLVLVALLTVGLSGSKGIVKRQKTDYLSSPSWSGVELQGRSSQEVQ